MEWISHILFLWTLIWRNGRPWLYVLFPAGCIFGLYEAYITKVLWNPTWDTAMPHVFGIALTETMVLVLFWHNFMSFIIPLIIAEATFTNSNEIYSLLPAWALRVLKIIDEKKLVYILPFFGGIFQSTGAGSILDAALSGIITTLFVVVLLVFWRRRVGTDYKMRDLLPDSRQFKIIGILLGVYYLITTILLRPEEIPGLKPQSTIWILYFFFGTLLYQSIKRSREVELSQNEMRFNPEPLQLMILGALLSLGSIVGYISGLNYVMALVVWLLGILFGLYVTLQTIRNVFML
jgi:hypothetical protein